MHLSRMHSFAMRKTVSGACESFRTVRTLIRPRTRMLIYVKFQILITLERLITKRARVRSQVRVRDAVGT